MKINKKRAFTLLGASVLIAGGAYLLSPKSDAQRGPKYLYNLLYDTTKKAPNSYDVEQNTKNSDTVAFIRPDYEKPNSDQTWFSINFTPDIVERAYQKVTDKSLGTPRKMKSFFGSFEPLEGMNIDLDGNAGNGSPHASQMGFWKIFQIDPKDRSTANPVNSLPDRVYDENWKIDPVNGVTYLLGLTFRKANDPAEKRSENLKSPPGSQKLFDSLVQYAPPHSKQNTQDGKIHLTLTPDSTEYFIVSLAAPDWELVMFQAYPGKKLNLEFYKPDISVNINSREFKDGDVLEDAIQYLRNSPQIQNIGSYFKKWGNRISIPPSGNNAQYGSRPEIP